MFIVKKGCQRLQCKNGGFCDGHDTVNPICFCTKGYSGTECDKGNLIYVYNVKSNLHFTYTVPYIFKISVWSKIYFEFPNKIHENHIWCYSHSIQIFPWCLTKLYNLVQLNLNSCTCLVGYTFVCLFFTWHHMTSDVISYRYECDVFSRIIK